MKGIIDTNGNLKDFILNKIQEFKITNPFILIYNVNSVLLGLIENNIFPFDNDEIDFEYLTELRVFSKEGEIYIWKDEDSYKYRVKNDDDSEFFERKYYMWGNEIKNNYLYEKNRGIRIGLSDNLLNRIKLDDLPLKYSVRNYFKYNDLGLIEFCDSRLVNILNIGKEVL